MHTAKCQSHIIFFSPWLQVTCSRCSQRAALTLDSEAISTSSSAAGSRTTEGSYPEAAATCAQCHAPMRLRMRPSFLTDASNVLGLLHATGCRPTDLLPSWLAAQCADCGSVMSLRGLQVRCQITIPYHGLIMLQQVLTENYHQACFSMTSLYGSCMLTASCCSPSNGFILHAMCCM